MSSRVALSPSTTKNIREIPNKRLRAHLVCVFKQQFSIFLEIRVGEKCVKIYVILFKN